MLQFSVGEEETFHDEKIRPCPQELSKKLDENENFSTVREVRFLKDHDPTLKSYIPRNPGDRVWLNGTVHVVLQQMGREWIVESEAGTQTAVHESELLAGKTLVSSIWDSQILYRSVRHFSRNRHEIIPESK